MSYEMNSPFLTISETAVLMRVKPRTLDNLRWRKRALHTGATEAEFSITGTRSFNGPTSAAREYKELRRRKVGRLVAIGLAALSVLAIGHTRSDTPLFLWNTTSSVPAGFYSLSLRQPEMGKLAVIRLPISLPYLPRGMPLIKRIAARAGYIVCRHGPIVTINGHLAAVARAADAAGGPLMRWSGCKRLRAAHAFVLSSHPDSFDSRYFGPVERRHVLGTARRIFCWRLCSPIGPHFARLIAASAARACRPVAPRRAPADHARSSTRAAASSSPASRSGSRRSRTSDFKVCWRTALPAASIAYIAHSFSIKGQPAVWRKRNIQP